MGTTVTGLAPRLSRKLKKVLESRTDSPNLLPSLNSLSSSYTIEGFNYCSKPPLHCTENTPQSRRNLRSTIEKHSLSINQFLAASDVVQLALDRVEEEANAFAECCDT